MLGVTDWTRASQDREQWRKVVENCCDDMKNGM
jgi:hypothetical protein